jgi:acyl dehydratase
MTRVFSSSAELEGLVGEVIGVSDVILVDQPRIDTFAQATGDYQWIHTEPERAQEGPFGAAIAHGFLTLSLIPVLAAQTYQINFGTARLNYGLEKVRFPSPVPAGSLLRGTAALVGFRRDAKGTFLTFEWTVSAEGTDRPACVATTTTLVIGESH